MTEYHSLPRQTRIDAGAMVAVVLDGREIAVANVGGSYYAVDNRCACVAHFTGHVADESADEHRHVGDLGRLTEGVLSGDTVSCPLHRTIYSLKNGAPLSGPGEMSLNSYEVRIDQGEIKLAAMSDSERHFWNDPGNKERP